eukprot:GHRQ01011911.1.p1 GENE.GHRQ01011911.1~~GHRQ01011911.1.p1  ORF type:complete len:231 (+),score=25.49 GHRQ01011911.1:151-843(+)
MTSIRSVLLPRRGWQQAAWLAAVMCSQLLLLSASAQSCQSARQCPFRLLAVGDSLTKGAVPSKQLNHPYSIRLRALLKKKFKNGATPVVTTAAYNFMGVFQKAQNDDGQALDTTLVPLTRRQLHKAKQQGFAYQWVVVMAGINDLGAGDRTAAEIMPRLVEVSWESQENIDVRQERSWKSISATMHCFRVFISACCIARVSLQRLNNVQLHLVQCSQRRSVEPAVVQHAV